MSEPQQDQAFQQLLTKYFPRDAVQIREDVRIVVSGDSLGIDSDADSALSSFLAGRT